MNYLTLDVKLIITSASFSFTSLSKLFTSVLIAATTQRIHLQNSYVLNIFQELYYMKWNFTCLPTQYDKRFMFTKMDILEYKMQIQSYNQRKI